MNSILPKSKYRLQHRNVQLFQFAPLMDYLLANRGHQRHTKSHSTPPPPHHSAFDASKHVASICLCVGQNIPHFGDKMIHLCLQFKEIAFKNIYQNRSKYDRLPPQTYNRLLRTATPAVERIHDIDAT